MSGDNIFVRPSTEHNRLKVATKEIGPDNDKTHYPQYIQVDGDGVEISDTNPLPIEVQLGEGESIATTPSIEAKVQQEEILEGIENIVKQLKMMNLYLQEMTGLEITKGDL